MRPCLICFFVHWELVKRLLVRPYSVRWFNMPYARIFCELRSISVSPLWAMKHTINDQNVALYVKPSNRGFIISLLFHFLVFWRPVLFETNAHTVLSEHRTNRTRRVWKEKTTQKKPFLQVFLMTESFEVRRWKNNVWKTEEKSKTARIVSVRIFVNKESYWKQTSFQQLSLSARSKWAIHSKQEGSWDAWVPS